MPKQIVSGHLTAFGPGQLSGVSYAFGEHRVDVAVPFWNEVTSDTRSGARPVSAVALTDLPVRVHVLPLLPDAPGLLLRVDYPMSGQAWTSVEEISDADRASVRREERGVRKFFFLAALVPVSYTHLLAIAQPIRPLESIGHGLDAWSDNAKVPFDEVSYFAGFGPVSYTHLSTYFFI